MIIKVIFLLSLLTSSQPEVKGIKPMVGQVSAIHYSVGYMENTVIKNRLDKDFRYYDPAFRLNKYVDGYTAVPECYLLGKYVVVKFWNPTTETWGKPEVLQITDCAQPYDYKEKRADRIGLETDGDTAIRNGFYQDWKTKIGHGRTKAIILRYIN